MNRIYFNLTRILNGWVLSYCPYLYESGLSGSPGDKYFKTLNEAYDFISAHIKAVEEYDSMSLRHYFQGWEYVKILEEKKG